MVYIYIMVEVSRRSSIYLVGDEEVVAATCARHPQQVVLSVICDCLVVPVELRASWDGVLCHQVALVSRCDVLEQRVVWVVSLVGQVQSTSHILGLRQVVLYLLDSFQLNQSKEIYIERREISYLDVDEYSIICLDGGS